MILLFFVGFFTSNCFAELIFEYKQEENSLMIKPDYTPGSVMKDFEFPDGKAVRVKLRSLYDTGRRYGEASIYNTQL